MFFYWIVFFYKYLRECICFINEIVNSKSSNNKKYMFIFILLLGYREIICNVFIYKDEKNDI